MIKVFLVDDEPLVIDVLKHKVPWKMFDMEVVGFALDGNTALAFIEQNDIDIVFTDVKMPLMDGYVLIEKAMAVKPDMRFVVLSSYSDFPLVKRSFQAGALDYILKVDIDSATMLDSLSRYKHLILETPKAKKILESYVRDTIRNNPSVRLYSQYMVVVINQHQNEPEEVIKANLKKMEQESSVLWLVLHKEILVVFNLGKAGPESSHRLMSRKITGIVADRILKNAAKGYIVGISSIGALHMLDTLYAQAREKTESMRFYADLKNLHEILFTLSDSGEISTDKYKDELRSLMNNMELIEAGKVLVNFLETLKAGRVERKMALDLASDLYLYYTNKIFDLGLLPKMQTRDSFHIKKQIGSFTTFHQLKNWFTDHIGEFDSYFNSLKKSQQLSLIKLYLEQNFHKNLSLRDIAQKFGFSESYLSRKFSAETGVRLVEYISLLRLEKAKKLLVTTDMKMPEISEKVGYSNVEHFSRVFKEYIGVSPLIYKNSNQQ